MIQRSGTWEPGLESPTYGSRCLHFWKEHSSAERHWCLHRHLCQGRLCSFQQDDVKPHTASVLNKYKILWDIGSWDLNITGSPDRFGLVNSVGKFLGILWFQTKMSASLISRHLSAFLYVSPKSAAVKARGVNYSSTGSPHAPSITDHLRNNKLIAAPSARSEDNWCTGRLKQNRFSLALLQHLNEEQDQKLELSFLQWDILLSALTDSFRGAPVFHKGVISVKDVILE